MAYLIAKYRGADTNPQTAPPLFKIDFSVLPPIKTPLSSVCYDLFEYSHIHNFANTSMAENIDAAPVYSLKYRLIEEKYKYLAGSVNIYR